MGVKFSTTMGIAGCKNNSQIAVGGEPFISDYRRTVTQRHYSVPKLVADVSYAYINTPDGIGLPTSFS
jgi:hypothetical protein